MELVHDKSFREDLYFRINVLQLTVPPLRERREDIEEIAKHHFAQISPRRKKKKRSRNQENFLTPSVLNLLYQYQFPGNIRELQKYFSKKDSGCIAQEKS